LLRQLADRTGLTCGLSAALPSPLGGYDRGRVLADLACAIADGARVISDFRVMGDQRELFGPVASVPTVWRGLEGVAGGGDGRGRRITAAVNMARRPAWAQVIARHGALPPVRLADRALEGVTCIRLDATVTAAHSDKELAEANFHRICSGNKFRPIKVHHLRHTTATLLKNLGVPARDAQIILGHSRLAVTLEIYTHEDRQAQREALGRISEALGHATELPAVGEKEGE